MNKIYFMPTSGWTSMGMHGAAIAEDGEVLATCFSSNFRWLENDLNSKSKRPAYLKKYPNGYEIVWIEEPAKDPVAKRLLSQMKS